MLPKPPFTDTIRGRWAEFTLKEQEWTHPITSPSLFGMLAARWWRSTTRLWVERATQFTNTKNIMNSLHYRRRCTHPLFLFNDNLKNVILLILSLCFPPQQVSVAPLCTAQASAVLFASQVLTAASWAEERGHEQLFLYLFSDFPMQLNLSLFEFNGRTGYLLKHDVLRRSDKKFDLYCDRIDTVVASTLTIKAGLWLCYCYY